MKKLAFACAVLVTCVPVFAQETEVRKTLEEYARAWSARSPGEIARFYSEDADLLTGGGKVRGPQAIERMHAREFAALPKDSSLTLDIDAVRLLKPDYAMVDGTYQIGKHGKIEHSGEDSTNR